MAKKKKLLKKLAKAALIGGGLYAATRGLKGRADKLTEGDIGIGQRAPIVEDAPYITKKKPHFDPHFYAGNKKGGRVKSMGIAKRGGGVAKR